MRRLLCICALAVCVAGALGGDSVDEAEAKRREVPVEQVEIEKLKRTVTYFEDRNKELQSQLVKKQKELEIKTSLLQTQLDTQTAQAQAEIKRLGAGHKRGRK